MNQHNLQQIRIIRTEDQNRLGDLYWNGTTLYLLVKIRRTLCPIPVDYLIRELTRDLPSNVPVPTI